MPEQIGIPAAIYRGGTSKGVILMARDLPPPGPARDAVIRAVFGTPDARQIDGLGGADFQTSKLCILGPATIPGADLDYTFVQVGIESPNLGYDINCGNMSSAVAICALHEGFVKTTDDSATVRIHNTNTATILTATVAQTGGEPRVDGGFTVDGVPGTGAEIRLDYSLTVGGATGKLLPTGRAMDLIPIPGTDAVARVSVVDIANLSAFVQAEDVGLTGTELPGEVPQEAFDRLSAIKRALTERLGLAETSLTPMMAIVCAPVTHRTREGVLDAGEVDFIVRGVRTPTSAFPVGSISKAFPGTVSICCAVARGIPGTVVASNVTDPQSDPRRVRFGHSSGVTTVDTLLEIAADGEPHVRQVGFSRTARRIMTGTVFIPTSKFPALNNR